MSRKVVVEYWSDPEWLSTLVGRETLSVTVVCHYNVKVTNYTTVAPTTRVMKNLIGCWVMPPHNIAYSPGVDDICLVWFEMVSDNGPQYTKGT